MPALSNAINSMTALLVVTFLGWVAARQGFLTPAMRRPLTGLILNITLPATILASVSETGGTLSGEVVAWTLGLAAVYFPIMLVAGLVCVLVLRVPVRTRTLYVFMSVFTNTGFIGIAAVSAIFGGPAAFMGSVFVAVANVWLYSVGIAILASGRGQEASDGPSRPLIDWRSLVNAPLISSVIALARFFSSLPLPGVVTQTLDLLGGATSPLAMMIVGATVAEADLDTLLRDPRLHAFTWLRYLGLPALVLPLVRAWVPDPTLLGVLIVMLTMPVGSMTPLMATRYGKDVPLAARATILTTIASFVFIPLMIWMIALITVPS